MSGRNFYADTTRRTVEAVVGAVAKSLKAQKKQPPKDLASLITLPRRGHYVLNATGFVD